MKETADNLDRYYTDSRGRKVHVIRFDRQKQRVIYMRENYGNECFFPLDKFREEFTAYVDEVKP